MITLPTTVFNRVAYDNISPGGQPALNAAFTNISRFDKLFELVFHHLKVQKLTTYTDLSTMLGTIADVAATK